MTANTPTNVSFACQYGTDADECATARERLVAGVSDELPPCLLHQGGHVYQISTTQRDVLVWGETPEQAKLYFLRKVMPPEPMPKFPGENGTTEEHQAWHEAWLAYFDRWPVLAWAHGECLMSRVPEAV